MRSRAARRDDTERSVPTGSRGIRRASGYQVNPAELANGSKLVQGVSDQHASFQPTRPPRGPILADSVYNRGTMTWVIPTKNPLRLKAALAAAKPLISED